jgi:hypothetical protein
MAKDLNRLAKLILCLILVFFWGYYFLTNQAKAGVCDCVCRSDCSVYPEPGPIPCCVWKDCPFYCGDPECVANGCTYCEACGGCFTGEVEIGIEEIEGTYDTREIKDLKEGDIVSSFDPETGEITESAVLETTKLTREGYYELETESGKKVKVTTEHPLLAVKVKNFQFPISNYQLIDRLSNIFSHTLTYRVITGLQTKVTEILH